MSKANQKFVQADEAVSPVIGVILMVAITVVLAAVVFVLVSNLSKTSDKAEDAGAQVTSPSAGVISVTIIKAGEHTPYSLSDSCSAANAEPNCASILINGVECSSTAVPVATDDIQGAGAGADAFGVGASVRVTAGAAGGVCNAEFAAGDNDVQVTVTVAGTVIYDSAIDIDQ